MIRNVIFDWSGTLVDDLPAVLKASNVVLSHAGKPPMSLDEFRAEFRLPFTDFYNRHTPGIPMPRLEKWFHAGFRQTCDSICEIPHARQFLEFCRERKLRLFVLSTIFSKHFAAQCHVTGFDRFIEKSYTDVWDKRKKIHDVLRDNRLRAAETLFIGDMQHDIETARHGGVHSCAVLTGYNTLEQLRAARPDLIVEHLGELRQVLELNALHLKPVAGTSPEAFEQTHAPIATVGALVFDPRGRVLMIRTRKWSDLWGIPGGKIKWGEPSENALRREILEETALKIADIRFMLVQDCIHSKEFYRDVHFVLLNYTCRCAQKNPRVKLNQEGREFRWVTLAEARKMELNSPTKILVNAVAMRRKAA